MTKDLEALKAVFLATDVDEETRAENERLITQWEHDLIQHEAFASWQGHDITKQIVQKAKETYRDIGLQLATDRKLTEAGRHGLYARQDACKWILSLIDIDAKATLDQLHKQIRTALNTTN